VVFVPAPSPRSPAIPTDLSPLAPGALHGESTHEQVVIGDEDLSGLHAPDLTLRSARLHATHLPGADLPGLELTDVELSSCDLANARLGARAGWLRVAAKTCRLTGIAITDGLLRDVTIESSRVDLASFAGCRLERVSFIDCVLVATDFLEAQLDAVRFTDCDLREVDLRGARLRRCELRRCQLDGLQGVAQLRGVAMPWPDLLGAAGLFAQALGIEVLDDGLNPR
jgi:uncharacterized protein YjbI with pentapeptide repeats